jgi:hypothetical protein
MIPSASIHGRADRPHGDHRILWAYVIAALFVAVAAISFAVDQSLTLSP